MEQADGHHDPVCESVVFLSNFPHTQMPENTQRCETAGEDGTRRCKYVGRKIGEALRWVEDRDLLTMMLVFMCNTLVFVFSVSLRSSGHRCQRRKTLEEEDGGPQFDVANFDTNPSLIPEDDDAEDVASLRAKVVGGLKVIRDSRRRPQGDSPMGGEYADADIFETGMHGSLSSSPTAGDAKKAASKQQAEEDSELDLAKVSLEMLGLVNIVRQPDEVVYVHCGADAYLYMKYQKYMINMLWVMFVTSVLVLLPNQYGKRESNDADSRFLNTFYLWANAANLQGKDEGGGRMFTQLYATFFFSFLVFVWLTEFRKLMVKLTDPTYIAELNSQVVDVERWGSEDDSEKAAAADLVLQEARARTLEVQNIPVQLSRHEIRQAIETACPDQLLEVHVPARCGRSLLSRTNLEYFQPQGAGSGTAFLTFKQRAHARGFRDAFKKMRAISKKKQSLSVNLGAVGTFGFDIGVELPEFMQETIDRVTDVDAHLEMVLNQVETNVVRAEDVTDSVASAARGLLCCCGRRSSRAASPDSVDGRRLSSVDEARLSALRMSDRDREGDTETNDGSTRASFQRRHAVSPDSLASMAAELSQIERERERQNETVMLLSFPEHFQTKHWKVNWAPEAGDILWGNLHISGVERKLRKAIWSVIIATCFVSIAYAYNKYAMETTMVYLLTEATKTTTGIKEGAMFDNSLNGKSYQFGKLVYGMVTIYAPVVVLCMVNYGILPVVCMVSSVLEGRKNNSSIQKAVLRKNYMLMIINILILPTLALKTPDAFIAQFKQMSDNIQMTKSYDWTIGYCHNGCQCYGATSVHVCNDREFSQWEKTKLDESGLFTFHECQRRPCEPGDVPGDNRKTPGKVGPRGQDGEPDPRLIPAGHFTWGCYNATEGQDNNIMPSWLRAHKVPEGVTVPRINGCSRNSSNDFGEPAGPDYFHLWPVCQESKIYCHHVSVHCQGQCETNDYLKIVGNFVLAANASFLYCFVVSAALLGTGWQLLNLAFYCFCLLQLACKKRNSGSENDDGLLFWDIATDTSKVQASMKEEGYAFEIGYYYAVGLVIFAIVIFYSVHFPPVCFAGLLYFNCKHFVDKYNLLYVYPVNGSQHVRSGGQMGGTVHDLVLFSLCLMQLGMAAFFKVKDPDSVRWALYLFATTLAWFFVSVRRASPADSEIVFGDENIEILDVPGTPTTADYGGDLNRTTTTSRKATVTRRQLAQAYAQPVDRAAINQFI